MGLLRSLMKLFAPHRQAHRNEAPTPRHPPPPPWAKTAPPQYSPPPPEYRPAPAPTEAAPAQNPLQERLRHSILKGSCWVIDGDTIVINKTHIRLAGIDAPELDHPYGKNAKRALMQLCRGQIVTAIPDGSTSHERTVAMCHLEDGRDLSAEMVKAGFALDWEKHSGGRYRHLEVEGIRKKLWRVEAKHKGKMRPLVRKDE